MWILNVNEQNYELNGNPEISRDEVKFQLVDSSISLVNQAGRPVEAYLINGATRMHISIYGCSQNGLIVVYEAHKLPF